MFEIEEIKLNVYHLEYDTQYNLTSSFMRLQEYYESPYEELKGKFFKHETFFDVYTELNHSKEFTYFTDWCGFNIPGLAAKDFYKLFHNDFWNKERILFESLKNKIGAKNWRNIYIIGSNKCVEQKETIVHELAHAYWYLYPDYKKEMESYLNDKSLISQNKLDYMFDALKIMGYSTEYFYDEIQAFLATGSKYEISHNLKAGMDFNIPKCFKIYFNKFNKKV